VTDRSDYATASQADVAVLRDAFTEGKEITKDFAADVLGIPERRMRAAVAELRDEGMPIVSFSDADSTYHLARDAAEADRFIDTELVPRIRKLERRARRIRENKHRWLDQQQQLI
jgi:DNA-binding transcriptional regulator PaaX